MQINENETSNENSTGNRQVLLLVDDNENTLLTLEEIFKDQFDTITCNNGIKAISIAKRVHVDLILMDVNMPHLTGYDICAELQRRKTTASIPVIFLTGEHGRKAVMDSLQAGAVDHIEKPTSLDVLIKKIENHMTLAKQRKELTELSNTDTLTGIGNRRFIDTQLSREWYSATRSGQPLSILMIDIDDFKKFNDTFGHVEGDICLQKVAAALQQSLHRKTDAIGRFGGEEFLAVLPQSDTEGAVEIAKQLLQSTSAVKFKDRNTQVTVSIGIATFTPDNFAQNDTSLTTLLNTADANLYTAKKRGKNTYQA